MYSSPAAAEQSKRRNAEQAQAAGLGNLGIYTLANGVHVVPCDITVVPGQIAYRWSATAFDGADLRVASGDTQGSRRGGVEFKNVSGGLIKEINISIRSKI